MRKIKRNFTLLELLVAVAVIAILVSLLLPSLGKARREARSTVCMSNLRNLGLYTHMFTDDNDGNIPARLLWYSGDYSGDWGGQQSYRWYSFLALYMDNSGFENDVYRCPSETITHEQDTGDKVEYSLSYWVNNFEGADGRRVWIDNWGITDPDIESPKLEEYVKINEILQPSQLASIYDCAQGWKGAVPESGAGGFISAGTDVWDAPWPRPSSSLDPDTLIGYKEIPSQKGVYYTRGSVDFRHNRDSMNTVNFDGSGTKLYNGRVLNKNMVNQ